jgi:hypothetical protein
MLERIKENMAADYLEADCRLMVGDIRIWSGRYVSASTTRVCNDK